MEVVVQDISPDHEALSPTLTISIDLKYYSPIEMPLLITGKMKTSDGKRIATLQEIETTKSDTLNLDVVSSADRQKIFSRLPNIYYTKLTATLTHQAIDHIEKVREKNPSKDVDFYFELVVKSLETIDKEHKHRIGLYKLTPTFSISHGLWIRRYTEFLKIGNFVLIELQIPN